MGSTHPTHLLVPQPCPSRRNSVRPDAFTEREKPSRMAAVDIQPGIDQHEPQTAATVVLVGQALAILLPIAIWFSPLPLEPQTKHAFAIVAFMVVCWIFQAIDYALAGFIGCFLFWV